MLEVPWRSTPGLLLRDFERDLVTPDELLGLPGEFGDSYVSMLHTIRHDRGLTPEGGATDLL